MGDRESAAAEERQAQFGQAVELCERRRYYQAAELLQALHRLPVLVGQQELHLAVQSYLGLSIARSVGDYDEGRRLARVGLASRRYRAHACHNLALIYLDQKDRGSAVPLIHKGLRVDPRHRGLLLLAKSIGVRRRPPLSFLRRGHPLNVLLGRLRRRLFPQRGIPLPVADSDAFYFE